MRRIGIVLLTAMIIMTIAPMMVAARTSEIIIPDGPLQPGKLSEVLVIVREVGTKALVEGAEVSMIGCGVNMHKFTNHKGEAVFAVVPTETGRIKITATYDGLMPTDTEIPVVPDKSAPPLDIDPIISPTSDKQLTVKGKTRPGAEVYVGDVKAAVDATGDFQATIALDEGTNSIIVRAKTKYATSTKQIDVVVDTIEPSMFLENDLKKEHYVDVDTVTIRGRVEPGSTVTVNGVKATVVNDFFVVDIPVELGVNSVVIEAYDKVGNKSIFQTEVEVWTLTDVRVTIGSDIAYVNGEAITLEASPVIIGGRTLVPLRFVGEAFGAEFEWEASTKTITLTLEDTTIVLQVGSSTAVVNGNVVTLDAPPSIVNNRTMVPFRFIGEQLGCELVWDANTKTVILTKETLPQ
ncbi:MAG TPA: stalk domain-containing protein [Caldisericia bacterium]|nr:stalk domain-containing protein [Caldisericia bacterium]HPF49634.1 stalk domain-containing protein [Caldisericia bacterium]HPI84616.1 stalk domain-containing protein [Caldisericia bacterium]HPQ92174.1 stalk domain-containing protein [Caldisericia bacterium]HRV74728.1 stalk domain-containing protein [Caldisericia bacterium]